MAPPVCLPGTACPNWDTVVGLGSFWPRTDLGRLGLVYRAVRFSALRSYLSLAAKDVLQMVCLQSARGGGGSPLTLLAPHRVTLPLHTLVR